MLDPEAWRQIWNNVLSSVATWLPSLLVALVLLVAGWLIALLIQAITTGLLRRLGLDRLADRAGLAHVLTNVGLDGSASRLVGRIAYWLILLFFVLAAVESVGLDIVTDTLRALVAYLPQVLAAAIILILGSVLARVVGDTVGALAIQSGIKGGSTLGQAVRVVVIGLTIILTLDQLNVRTDLLSTLAIVIVAAMALAMALAFGLGSRELARSIMAGFHVKELFVPGQTLTVRRHTGRLESIGSATSVLKTKAGRLSVPNDVLIGEEVLIAPEQEATGDPG